MREKFLALLVFSGLVLRGQKPNVLKCAVGLRHGMKPNDQIWRVAIPFVNTSKVVKLPNPRNSIHNALRPESLIQKEKSG